MDIIQRCSQIAERAIALRSRHLAEKDLAWWAKKIARENRVKRNRATDADRFFIRHPIRANVHYRAALKELLGEGFVVEATTGFFSDGVATAFEYPCTAVLW